jgi:4-methyl-5(b-hydroxyethyl)-thiazole monophosphate biosynthesis
MNEKPRVAVLLAEGFEEVEAVAIIDVLRRSGIDVTSAAAAGPGKAVTGAHRICLTADAALDDLQPRDLAMVVLPGGMPGSTNLAANPAVLNLLRVVHGAGGWVAAICAAPIVLQAAGLLHGRRVTCYPSCEAQLTGAVCTGQAVQRDDHIITSRGPGTALVFALELARALGRDVQAEQVRQQMLIDA